MTAYTCLACPAPVTPANAVIVGLDLAGFPEHCPSNVVAHQGCEDRGRAMSAKALDAQERGSEVNIPVYDPTGRCPKCNGGVASTRYVKKESGKFGDPCEFSSADCA